MTASNNLLFATHWGAHRIYCIDPNSGNTAVYAGSSMGSKNGDLNTATFNFPNGIYMDVDNNRIYISDAGSSNLRIIDKVESSSGKCNSSNVGLKITSDRNTKILNISANLKSIEDVTIQVFEAIGKEVLKKEYSRTEISFSTEIDIEKFKPGNYVVLFSQADTVWSHKMNL